MLEMAETETSRKKSKLEETETLEEEENLNNYYN